MIRVAAGEALSFKAGRRATQRLVDGMPYQCRDPFRGFLPSTGRLVKFAPPEEVAGQVRVDTGVYEGGRNLDVLRLDDRQTDCPRRNT